MIFLIQMEVIEDAQLLVGIQLDIHQTSHTIESNGKSQCRLNNILLQKHDRTPYHDFAISHM